MATTKATTLAHTLGGISSDISTAEINRLDGVTGDLQTQLDAKAPLASPDFTGTVDLTGTTISLDNDQISGDKISGGTIGAGTFNGIIGSSADLSTLSSAKLSSSQAVTSGSARVGDLLLQWNGSGFAWNTTSHTFTFATAYDTSPLVLATTSRLYSWQTGIRGVLVHTVSTSQVTLNFGLTNSGDFGVQYLAIGKKS